MSENFVLLTLKNGVRTITLNRPNVKNAINQDMYEKIKKTMNNDAVNDEVVITILTGTGNYYSSGNDIKSSMETVSDPENQFRLVEEMIQAFINFPKLLIAVVNGPAIGIAATTVALCDIIYASENAVFDTPFLKMGLCAEGGSSYTFPFTFGRSIASEVIILNRKLSASEAYQFGLISKVVPLSELQAFMENLHEYGKLPLQNVKRNKALIMANFKKVLIECNQRETKALKECIESDEFITAAMSFLNKKSKL
ncbi:enoyl-CoA delta isomerase 2 [Cylas formicarius]|uniref:enoyl-CoA delta isomerase 2 n=1 Tax=Cylas formicarius TaxID=197179 RepID=UPI0029585763|nr:enoyl-CoA delta isomerase 2 [Cylas formicarius]